MLSAHQQTSPFSKKKKLQLNYTSCLKIRSLQVPKSPNPGPHNHHDTQRGYHLYKNLIGPPQTSSGGDTDYHDPSPKWWRGSVPATTRFTSVSCLLNSQAGARFRQVGVPILRHFLPSQLVKIVQDPCTATHSPPRRETPIHNGGSPPHRWCTARQQNS